ncbi:hypothetical protein [Paraburkholderia sp. BCC1884]|uniref:hypothetical protein n=1 Tax=Paraburkholderia sp. BCC1884 TaxID=2562668 RepID=UPI0011843E1C|nr:hypothetical protein [Paraburkholderia sp. BCC1884]
MRLRKTEWVSLALVGALVAGFGSWLQGEMNRATFARTQRETLDQRGACSGMTLQESQTMDKGALWCGVIDAARAGSLTKP